MPGRSSDEVGRKNRRWVNVIFRSGPKFALWRSILLSESRWAWFQGPKSGRWGTAQLARSAPFRSSISVAPLPPSVTVSPFLCVGVPQPEAQTQAGAAPSRLQTATDAPNFLRTRVSISIYRCWKLRSYFYATIDIKEYEIAFQKMLWYYKHTKSLSYRLPTWRTLPAFVAFFPSFGLWGLIAYKIKALLGALFSVHSRKNQF